MAQGVGRLHTRTWNSYQVSEKARMPGDVDNLIPLFRYRYRVIFTEAYANISFTMKYYQQDNGQSLSHFPFNFNLIDDNLEWDKTAANFKSKIDSWLNNMPSGRTANWVVSIS